MTTVGNYHRHLYPYHTGILSINDFSLLESTNELLFKVSSLQSNRDTYLRLDSSHNFSEYLLIAKEFTCSNKRIFHSICPGDVRCNLAMHRLVTPFVIWQLLL